MSERSATIIRGGGRLRVVEAGEGIPVVFQHGLGGDAAQAAQNFPETAGLRRLTLECRGHGGSEAGDQRPFRIAMFADDVLAAADAAGMQRFVVGGVSMGAAIALRIAIRRPDRVAGLVLVRPAWLVEPAPANMAPFVEVARLLRAHAPDRAKAAFAASATAAMLAREAPDNLTSLLGFFDRPMPGIVADLLEGVALDGPGVTEAEARAVALPALVVGNQLDHVHPLAYASALAGILPVAQFVEVAAKATDAAKHFSGVRAAAARFLATLENREGVLSS